MTRDEVYSLMKSSKSEREWNDNCDRVKRSHGGQYPDYWYGDIVLSGLLSATQASWSNTPAR